MQTSHTTPEVQDVVSHIKNRQLTLPVLLFLSAHYPLAFAFGQLLHLATPMASLCGLSQCATWADLFSSPTGVAQLEALLRAEL